MDALTLSTVCILCTTAPASPPLHQARWAPLIAEASARFRLPQGWIARVMQAESGGQTQLNGQPITSAAGAMGLMQVMPSTYDELRRKYGLGADPYAPRDNILAGAAYLKEMYERYGYPNLFAAYNAGPKRLDDFQLAGHALPAATLAYVDSIIPHGSLAFAAPENAPKRAAAHGGKGLFVTLTTTLDTATAPADSAQIAISSRPAQRLATESFGQANTNSVLPGQVGNSNIDRILFMPLSQPAR